MPGAQPRPPLPTPECADSTRRALREALAALNRGDLLGANAIARAHAAQGRARTSRLLLILPLRAGCGLVDDWGDTEAS